MAGWILILAIITGNGTALTKVTFADKDACTTAGQRFADAATDSRVVWSCAPLSSGYEKRF